MNQLVKIILSSFLVVSMASCYYDNKDQMYPQVAVAACDTATINYSTTITNILNSNCNSCHSTAAAASSGGGIALDNYTAVKVYVSNGKLYGSMAQNGTASPMPKNMAKLDNCTINKVAIWINRGALNN
jgi:mono/diheme cytochrome c family protein